MIHFDFIITDEEAESLFDSITEQIFNSQYQVFFGEEKYKDWHRSRIEYLKKLKEKMTNSKIF